MKPLKSKVVIIDKLKYLITAPKLEYSKYEEFTREHYSSNVQYDPNTKKVFYFGNFFDYVYYPVGTFHILKPKAEFRNIEILDDIIVIKPTIIKTNRNIYINV